MNMPYSLFITGERESGIVINVDCQKPFNMCWFSAHNTTEKEAIL